MDDGLVPPENADFAQRMLKPERLKVTRVPGLNHFVPWARKDLLDAAILEALGPTSKP
jgi:pimeloyl-ACP methyl ester carboxylesterase